MMPTSSDTLALALQQHQAGELAVAERLYREILASDPCNHAALHLLGVLAYHVGEHAAAIHYIEQAIFWHSTEGRYHADLGEALKASGNLGRAIESYQRALSLNPALGIAYNGLGTALQDLGQLSDATKCYQRAVDLEPSYAAGHCNLGSVLHLQGRLDDAIACYRAAIALQGDYPEAYTNLGAALKVQARYTEARECCRRALELRPNFAEALNNLGIIHQDLGELRDAAACYTRALELNPNHAEAQNNLGAVLQERGELSQSAACFERALRINPQFVEALHNLGNTLHELGDLNGALDCHRRSWQLRPDFWTGLSSLVMESQQLCEWGDLERLSRRLMSALNDDRESAKLVGIHPFPILSLPTISTPAEQLSCARRWAEHKFPTTLSHVSAATTRNGLAATFAARLKVGYLSADFRAHPIAYLIGELLERHDRGSVEVFGYSYGPDDGSPIRQRLMAAVDQFVDFHDVASTTAAQRIVADGIDILVDLTGYTRLARTEILAMRPAPIQVNYLGYPGTLGAPFVDYLLGDAFVTPFDQQPFYSERLVQLPGCYQVNDGHRAIAAESISREACGLPREAFVFCCFNNSYKITPRMFTVWMNLLRAVPGSVLWLLEGNAWVPGNLRREAEARGISGNRLVFASRLPPAEHLARHRHADLFLDTMPYNAHVTASDALWAGCPIVTVTGSTFASRVCGSLLRAIGLPELVASTLEEYENLARRLAQERSLLADIRERLVRQRATSRLFDANSFARSLERAYRAMWDLYREGQRPRAFAVTENGEINFQADPSTSSNGHA